MDRSPFCWSIKAVCFYYGLTHIKFTLLTIFEWTALWHFVHSHCCVSITTMQLQNSSFFPNGNPVLLTHSRLTPCTSRPWQTTILFFVFMILTHSGLNLYSSEEWAHNRCLWASCVLEMCSGWTHGQGAGRLQTVLPAWPHRRVRYRKRWPSHSWPWPPMPDGSLPSDFSIPWKGNLDGVVWNMLTENTSWLGY